MDRVEPPKLSPIPLRNGCMNFKGLPESCISEAFEISPEDGIVTWKISSGSTKIGDVVGYKRGTPSSYAKGSLNGVRFRVHELIYWWVHKELPKEIDHIDRDKLNNKISNLRGVSNQQNQRNRKVSKNNTSGTTGVSRFRGKWQASIKVDGKKIHLGIRNSLEEAVKLRENAETKYNWKGATTAFALRGGDNRQ